MSISQEISFWQSSKLHSVGARHIAKSTRINNNYEPYKVECIAKRSRFCKYACLQSFDSKIEVIEQCKLFMDSRDRPADANPPIKSLIDTYLELIDRIIDTIMQGKIRSLEQIYQMLAADVAIGTGEIFERAMTDRHNTIQNELDSVVKSPQLFQNPEVKQARWQRQLKALQQIQKQWERWQQQNRVAEAIASAIGQISAAAPSDRFTALLRAIDPNQPQPFTPDRLQQLATALKAAGSSTDEDLNRQLPALGTGISRGLASCQQLESYLVRWLYESGTAGLGFGGVAATGRNPWAMWAQQVTSPLPKLIFSTLASDGNLSETISHQPNLGLEAWVELAVILQSLQGGLVTWFEQQPYDSEWGTTAASSAFLAFVSIWGQLSNGCQSAVAMNPTTQELLMRGCFQIALQTLRAFARRSYFPLYGGFFALFGDNYLQDAISYLDAPLRQVEGTQEKARILTLLGYSQRVLGRYDSAVAFHQQALEIAQSNLDGDRPCEIANLNHLSRIEVAKRNYEGAISLSQRALILARTNGDKLGEANALATLGYSELFIAQQLERMEEEAYERSIAYLERGLDLSVKLGDRQSQMLCSTSLGIARVVSGQPQAALPELKKAASSAQLSGDRYLLGLNFAYQAEAYYSLEDWKSAIYYGGLGMYVLEQIGASQWQQAAGLLSVLRGKIGLEAFQKLLSEVRAEIVPAIGTDGYDYLPELLKRYRLG